MDHIETAILNCYGIREAEQNMVFAARLTQHGHTIQNMADLMDLYRQSYSQKTVENIAGLPHPTVQKFMVITVAVDLSDDAKSKLNNTVEVRGKNAAKVTSVTENTVVTYRKGIRHVSTSCRPVLLLDHSSVKRQQS